MRERARTLLMFSAVMLVLIVVIVAIANQT